MKFRVLIINVLLLISIPAFAQQKRKQNIDRKKEYLYYSSIKVPLIDYLSYLIYKREHENSNSDGVIMDFGVSLLSRESFTLDTGVEYIVINQFDYQIPYYNYYNSSENSINIKNSALAFYVKPAYKIEIDESMNFRLFTCVGARKLFSHGELYLSQTTTRDGKMVLKECNSAKSRFRNFIQPGLGVDYLINPKIGLGFELSYISINWDKSIDQLSFISYPNLNIPRHQTSNVFFSGKIFF